jgi:hypothetical protein
MGTKGLTVSWRMLAAGAICLAVVFVVGRMLMGLGGGSSSVNNGDQQPTVPPQQSGGSLNGAPIPASGQPTVLLNPGLVRPGSKVGINGFGFDPGAVIGLKLKLTETDTGSAIGGAKADRYGNFTTTFAVPETLGNNTAIVQAQQGNSTKMARAKAVVPSGVGFVKLNRMVGKPGDKLVLSAHGFSPGEPINVYWGRLAGPPAAKLQADEAGGVGQAAIRVGVGAVGSSTLVLVGGKTQTVATAPFTMLSLYPNVYVHPYAAKAAEHMYFSAKGFAPGERILVYINAPEGRPAMTVTTGENGGFNGAGFVLPFGLKKHQSLILIGDESRAVVTSGFTVLPYMPSSQPSTYGGFPGTEMSFYAKGFAPNEVVLVSQHKIHDDAGSLITAFRVDGKGAAAAAGRYVIPGKAQGKMTFTLVGRQSQGVATATVNVQQPDTPVNIPPQPKYVLPADLAKDPPGPGQIIPPGSGGNGAAAPGPGENNPPAPGDNNNNNNNNNPPADNNNNNNPAPAPNNPPPNNPAPAPNNPPPPADNNNNPPPPNNNGGG